MTEALWTALRGLPPELTTFLIATLPVSELRGAIPVGIGAGGLSWPAAYLFAVLGNYLPVPFLLLWDRFFTWLFERTRRRGEVVQRYEALGLMLFVAIPLPITGAWTGCAAAFVFGIRHRLAFPAVLAGILISGAVVTLATLGVIGGIGLLTT